MAQKLDTKDKYIADHEAFSRNGGSGVPQWMEQLRDKAIQQFQQVGFPTSRDERWRFTSVAHLRDTKFALANGERPTLSLGEVKQHLFDAGRDQRSLAMTACNWSAAASACARPSATSANGWWALGVPGSWAYSPCRISAAINLGGMVHQVSRFNRHAIFQRVRVPSGRVLPA